MSKSAYTGVGSRDTPQEVLTYMEVCARALSEAYQLRSGGATGADTAFEKGAGVNKEIFTAKQNIPEWAFATVDKHHPAPQRLKPFPRRLMARNALQVLGPEGDDPSAFVLCWTPRGSGTGGTGQAIRIARAYSVPVFDLGDPVVHEWLRGVTDVKEAIDEVRP